MALTLPRWIMTTVLACAAITTAAIVSADRERPARPASDELPEVRARSRAWLQYVRAHRRWRSLARRDSILPTFSGRIGPAAGAPVIRAGSGISAPTVAALDRLVRRQWRALAIDSARYPVAIAIVREPRAEPGLPSVTRGTVGFDYLIPASGSSAPCVTVVIMGNRHADSASRRVLDQILAHGDVAPFLLGPCAFYARFGEPGPAMAEWIAARQYDLVSAPDWSVAADDADRPAGAVLEQVEPNWRRHRLPRWDQFGYSAYSEDWTSPRSRACLAGETDACAAIVAPPAGDPHAIAGLASRHALYRIRSAFTADDYLSDLVSYVGPERFAQLWRSSETVSTAIMNVTGSSLGEWTHRWGLAYYFEPLQVGPHVTPVEAAAAVALMLAGVAIACAVAQARQSK
jgi:hypothetical protein